MTIGFDVITIFPEIFHAYLSESILKRAMQNEFLDVKVYNLRDFTTDRHKTVDDYPYGGGAGMVMKAEPIYNAVQAIKTDALERLIVMLSPQGKRYNQTMAETMSQEKRRILFICGRYEGIDERVRECVVDEEISVGDYVLTGGELAALVIIDSITRLIPGVLGSKESTKEESFSWGILDYPHYTRPPKFNEIKVPDVLLSGNHKEISKWRRREAIKRTLLKRPDLIEESELDRDDYDILDELRRCSLG
ncbi:tRNA (guanosine(37)-N1)-methyltransferase TrmD [Thermodesulfovibrionales bacterium]|nr:tRNA (guanosine(37)-N1)-methyltransferase TrmD [Thermodesulfovibrionales bacterium]MCL0066694.1 tRNA (guanosine(37)-N1)-methyltransferase TrmD [Thermodesulfovibrionales bacterium]MCL0071387.1 tRNA (guanosine(37)-N1)-methyltransferase TrmD [Thermodesulfovibrionales bacterium]MCL0083283.1 tRNA (guanosine(37)-N1)-methyltransferase TrmD [Thermodesulfovibrionales bacterium]MCL0084809.1 tRNA (guanosine(37)-N1)-methyltransferase TrmD [Thermodesulfovibrionales bacterium]